MVDPLRRLTGAVPDPVRTLVWNREQRRPRALVRLLVATVLVALALGATVAVAGPVLARTDSISVRLFASLVSSAVPAVVAVAVAFLVDRRRVGDLGLHLDSDWWLDLLFGLVLGAGLMAALFAVSVGLGWARVDGTFVTVTGWGFGLAFLAVTGQFLVVGLAEEVLLRGYLLTNVAEGATAVLGHRASVGFAVVVSSVIFGLAHLGNPNATAVSTLGITLAGVLLAAGYVLTGELAIPVGIHVTWNLFQGAVFGFSVSGIRVAATVVETTETGPDIVTGGPFGPEAGLLGVSAILVGTAATAAYVGWRYGDVRVSEAVTVPDLRWRDR
jgi:hypothetical protein